MVAHEILEIAQAQVQGQRTKDLDLGYGLTLDLICPHPPPTHHQFLGPIGPLVVALYVSK